MTFHLDPEAFQAEYEDEQRVLRQLAEEAQKLLIIGLVLDLALAIVEAEMAERGEDVEPEGDLFDIVRQHEEDEPVLEADDLQEWRNPELSEGYEDNFTDAEADADTLASAGMGTDEDYGMFDGSEY